MRTRNTDLSFIIDIKFNDRKTAWLKRARLIIAALKQYAASKSQKEIATKLGLSLPVFIMNLTELRKVAKAGMTLEQYVESGRKFSTNNSVVAVRKNKKEKA